MKQKSDNRTADMDDVFLWSDGTWMHRYELSSHNAIPEECVILYFGTPEWEYFFSADTSAH